MEDLRRPIKIWERQGRRLCLSVAYLCYLGSLIQINEDEEKAFLELGVHLTGDRAERIEDFPGTAAFIEGDRA
jgi:hypothetical protein